MLIFTHPLWELCRWLHKCFTDIFFFRCGNWAHTCFSTNHYVLCTLNVSFLFFFPQDLQSCVFSLVVNRLRNLKAPLIHDDVQGYCIIPDWFVSLFIHSFFTFMGTSMLHYSHATEFIAEANFAMPVAGWAFKIHKNTFKRLTSHIPMYTLHNTTISLYEKHKTQHETIDRQYKTN